MKCNIELSKNTLHVCEQSDSLPLEHLCLHSASIRGIDLLGNGLYFLFDPAGLLL